MKDIKKIQVFCSKVREILGHPYFANWSTATNHMESEDNEDLDDFSYAIFRIGKYIDGQPLERSVIFGPIHTIADRFMGLNLLLVGPGDEPVINTWEDVVRMRDALMESIDLYALTGHAVRLGQGTVPKPSRPWESSTSI